MSFDKFGFLGSQIEEISKDLYLNNKEIFDLCYDLNHFTQLVKFEFSISQSNGQQMIVAALFVKILHGFQSAVLLIKKGLVSDGRVIVRSMMETMFTLKALCDNEKFVMEYVKSDDAKREKLINVIFNEPEEDTFLTVKNQIKPEFIQSLKLSNKEQKIRDISTQEWAEKAGLKSHYQTAYRILSDEVHATPRSLQKYFKEDEKGSFIVECDPKIEDLIITLITALTTLLISVDSLCTLFAVERDKEIKEFEDRIQVMS